MCIPQDVVQLQGLAPADANWGSDQKNGALMVHKH